MQSLCKRGRWLALLLIPVPLSYPQESPSNLSLSTVVRNRHSKTSTKSCIASTSWKKLLVTIDEAYRACYVCDEPQHNITNACKNVLHLDI